MHSESRVSLLATMCMRSGRLPTTVTSSRTGKRSWLHLDLYTANQREEVERLLALGASRYSWRYGPGADYVVLEDPDRNLFCVVQHPDPVDGDPVA